MKWLAKSNLATDDTDLFNFLTLDDQDSWLGCKKAKPIQESHQKSAADDQGSGSAAKEADTETLASLTNYCTELAQTLGALSRMAFKLLKSFTGILICLLTQRYIIATLMTQ